MRGKDAPERRLIVAPPCQSEIKRTLRRAGAIAEDGIFTARGRRWHRSINANGERRVSGVEPLWFRNGGCGRESLFIPLFTGINRKFTPNRTGRIFREFPAI
jgi:hypothetical protein